jgi:hypothetical protein
MHQPVEFKAVALSCLQGLEVTLRTLSGKRGWLTFGRRSHSITLQNQHE